MDYKWAGKLKDDNEEYKWEKKDLAKRNGYYLPLLLLLCVICGLIWKKRWVFVVSGGTPGGGQQQQGNASRTFVAGRYSVPISLLSNNYFCY